MSVKIKQSRSDRIFDIINITILSMIMIIILYPLIFVVSASFSETMLVIQGKVRFLPKGLNLEAYKAVFRNENIITGYKNTIAYTFVGTIVNLIMTTIGAYPLSRKDFRGRTIFTLFFMFTMFFSGGLIPTYLVIKKLGLYDNFWVMILPGAISVWNMTIMKSFFATSIPTELQEAAVIDGCGNIGVLRKIVIPLSFPILAVMLMYYGVAHWNSFFTALIYIPDSKKYPLQLVIRGILIQNDMAEMLDADAAVQQKMLAEGIKYAVIVVSSLPVLLLYPILQKYFVKGVMLGAVKG